MSKPGIEVFRDLTIGSDVESLGAIRASLLACATEDWVHAKAQENDLRKYGVGSSGEDVLVFAYDGQDFPKAGLTLWQYGDSYRVTNIVPREISELDVRQYNDILMDFVSVVVDASDVRGALNLDLTDDVRDLASWTGEAAASALKRFSALANKSTTNSHPNDRERWEEFVIAVHRSGDELPVDILMQWLISVDGWDETSANKLAIEFEQGISLLGMYDASLRG